jgi:quercetin dioxygenase-like cupin family protein
MNIKHSYAVPSEEVKAGKGTVRQVLIGSDEAPHFAMRRFIMQPGGGMPNHTNTVEHEQYVLRGKAKIGIGDRVFDVKPGDVVFIPAGVPHWYQCTGAEPFEFLCMVPNLPDTTEILK